ncbi:hypothetical protein ABTH20_21565, partial [Acinetobacter baumannii]
AVPPDTLAKKAAEYVQVAAPARHVGGISRTREDVMCLNVADVRGPDAASHPIRLRLFLIVEKMPPMSFRSASSELKLS